MLPVWANDLNLASPQDLPVFLALTHTGASVRVCVLIFFMYLQVEIKASLYFLPLWGR